MQIPAREPDYVYLYRGTSYTIRFWFEESIAEWSTSRLDHRRIIFEVDRKLLTFERSSTEPATYHNIFVHEIQAAYIDWRMKFITDYLVTLAHET